MVNELEIDFVAFDLQKSDGCSADYFEIDGRRYCGVQTGSPAITISFQNRPFIEFKFHSDLSIENTGFNIKIHQLDNQATTARNYTFTNLTLL